PGAPAAGPEGSGPGRPGPFARSFEEARRGGRRGNSVVPPRGRDAARGRSGGAVRSGPELLAEALTGPAPQKRAAEAPQEKPAQGANQHFDKQRFMRSAPFKVLQPKRQQTQRRWRGQTKRRKHQEPPRGVVLR